MITTKRQIRRDTDRFGGYGTERVSTLISDYDDITNSAPSVNDEQVVGSMHVADTDINIVNSAPAMETAHLYSTREDIANRTEVTPDVPPRPQKQEQPREREDILPTLKTRSYATENVQETTEKTTAQSRSVTKRTHGALESRTKILLCVYVAIALILAIAVIATGVSISSSAAEADRLSQQIAQRRVVIAEQEAELSSLLNEDTIRSRAQDNGMVEAGEPTYNVSPIEKVDYPQATPHTNGFDKFMDALSKIFN